MTVLMFLDLIIARVIHDSLEGPPSQRQLLIPGGSGGLVNSYLADNNVPLSYCSRLTSNQRLMTGIKRLRIAGLLAPEGAYAPTDELVVLFEKLGKDWSTWPLVLPCDQDGHILFEEAQYLRRVRNYRKRKTNGEPRSPS